MTDIAAGRQLTLDILPHPAVRDREKSGQHVWLSGSLQCKVDVAVHEDLNSGDRLVITVASEDGEILTNCYAEVGAVTLQPIHDKDLGYLGTERKHRAKLVDV